MGLKQAVVEDGIASSDLSNGRGRPTGETLNSPNLPLKPRPLVAFTRGFREFRV